MRHIAIKQQTLLDVEPNMRFKGAGHRRTHMGSIMEEVVCGLLRLTRAKTGGTAVYQPDAHDANERPHEIKSVCVNSKLKGKSVVYDWRLEKDRIHAPDLLYVFACHRSVGKGKAKDVTEFLDRLECNLMLAIVPAWVVRNDATTLHPLMKMKVLKRNGYDQGYRNLEVHRYLRDAQACHRVQFGRWGRQFTSNVFIYLPDAPHISPTGQ